MNFSLFILSLENSKLANFHLLFVLFSHIKKKLLIHFIISNKENQQQEQKIEEN